METMSKRRERGLYYDKRIRYLSYYESDIKLQNAGYVKFQVRDSLCQMVIYVKGPRLMGSGETTVYLLSRKQKESDEDSFYTGSRDSRLQKHLLGNLNIRGGQGHCAVRMNAENMADSGLRYDEICGIRIELHEYQYLESLWSMVNHMPEKRQPHSSVNEMAEESPVEVSLIVAPVSENAQVEKLVREEELQENRQDENETEVQPEIIVITEDSAACAAGDEDSMQGMLEREIRKEEDKTAQKTEDTEIAEAMQATKIMEIAEDAKEERLEEDATIMEEKSAEETAHARSPEQELRPDKWEQLRATYPIVHPIREEEEYLKITPRDFVIFTEKYQELVHNSFLLHGYHNYRHLILGKKEKEGRAVYYLGVPGTFHDREKAVAVMFGFEAFDGKREPAEKGDFGYYLRRVEI